MKNMTNETFEATDKDVQLLREWLKKMPHIPQDLDAEKLKDFIRGCKGSLQKTKLVLEKYCSLGQLYPDTWGQLDPLGKPTLQSYKTQRFFPLPKKTKDDCMVFLSRLNEKEHDPSEHNPNAFFRSILQMLMVSSLENRFGSGKIIIVADFRGMKLGHMKDITPTALLNWWDAVHSALPIRLQGIHAINAPESVEWIFKFIKSFVPSKFAQRIHVHSRIEALHQYVSPDVLTSDLGGKEESFNTLSEKWQKKLESHRNEIVNEESVIRALDYCRPKAQGFQHMEGTFKNLSLD